MSTNIVVPALGESVSEATVAKWFKQVGDRVVADERLVELETDKVTVEVPAPDGGVLSDISALVGANVAVGAVLGTIVAEGAAASVSRVAKVPPPPLAAIPSPLVAKPIAAPSAAKLMAEQTLTEVSGSGKAGRITKGDVLAALAAVPAPAPAKPAAPLRDSDPRETRVRMTRLRKRIAERLKEAQNAAAMLTTFNEVDMTALNAARALYKDGFEKKHGVKLGFMSFFVKACVTALKEWPAVNA